MQCCFTFIKITVHIKLKFHSENISHLLTRLQPVTQVCFHLSMFLLSCLFFAFSCICPWHYLWLMVCSWCVISQQYECTMNTQAKHGANSSFLNVLVKLWITHSQKYILCLYFLACYTFSVKCFISYRLLIQKWSEQAFLRVSVQSALCSWNIPNTTPLVLQDAMLVIYLSVCILTEA